MSGIAGIFNLDGQPVDRDLLERMTTAIVHRGPDGTGYWVDGAVGFGHQMLFTTPESLHEHQPLRDTTGQLCLVMDGRVDNCAELRSALRARGARPRDDTDAELVLCAYQVWGEDCPKEIIGDFAFVIWDARKRQLFCARDFLGIKPFYYHFDGRTFRFASELHQILEDPAISRVPNEGMVAEYLAGWMQSRKETLYQEIHRLLPAHYMLIRPGHIQEECYWSIDTIKDIRFKVESDYTEYFLDILKKSVRCRLRSHMPIGSYLSGGLDSSSIVAISQTIIKSENLDTPRFETFSLIFPEKPECDEREYIQHMVNMWDLKANIISPENISSDWYINQAQKYRDFPGYPIGAPQTFAMNMAKSLGFRVMLTGYGGDEWLTGSRYYYADMLYRPKIVDFICEIVLSLNFMGIEWTWKQLFKYGIRPIFPQHLRQFIRDFFIPEQAPDWIDNQLIQRSQLLSRIHESPITPLHGSYTKREMQKTVTDASLLHGREISNRISSEYALEERHPFNDQRIVEFSLQLPERQRRRQHLTKYILRKAMRGLLPPSILQRTDKAEFSHLFPEYFETVAKLGNLSELCISEKGWVNKDIVAEIYSKMNMYYREHNQEYASYAWRIWMTYGINTWFTTNFDYKDQKTSI